MPDRPGSSATSESGRLSAQEKKSLTHGEFWIPEKERLVYQDALRALTAAGVPTVVSGLYAIHEYTGIYRETKDLDLLLQPQWVVRAAEVLKDEGFRTTLEDLHWLAKATRDGVLVDMVFGMANGLHLIDDAWFEHSRAGILAAVPVRLAPPEELILHRLFISERHRFDMADIAHLIIMRGDELDWRRLLERIGDHWRLLLVQIHFFDFVYPGRRSTIPDWLRTELSERATREAAEDPVNADICQGTLVSKFSFAVDVNEWGFRDYRAEAVEAARSLPVVREIGESTVWDDRGESAKGIQQGS